MVRSFRQSGRSSQSRVFISFLAENFGTASMPYLRRGSKQSSQRSTVCDILLTAQEQTFRSRKSSSDKKMDFRSKVAVNRPQQPRADLLDSLYSFFWYPRMQRRTTSGVILGGYSSLNSPTFSIISSARRGGMGSVSESSNVSPYLALLRGAPESSGVEEHLLPVPKARS